VSHAPSERRQTSPSPAGRALRRAATLLRSLRARFLLAVGLLALVAVAAALVLVVGIAAATRDIETAAAAHRRVELLGSLSARVGDYALLLLQAATPAGAEPAGNEPPGATQTRLDGARGHVERAFDDLDAALRAEIERTPGATAKTQIATRSIVLARMRARFRALDRQALQMLAETTPGAPPDPNRLRATLDTFATSFAPLLAELIDEERRTSLVAQSETKALRDRVTLLGVAAVCAVLLLAVFVYLTVVRPVAARAAAVARAVGDIGAGRFDTRLAVGGRDELSLLMLSVNRMAARLARREAGVVADRARLTEIIEANTADLRAANRSLEAIDTARRRFFADVSHELRTPLTVILGEADVTLRAAQNPESVYRAALATIRQRGRRLRRRVEDLLRVARSENGQIELANGVVDVAQMVADAVEDVSALGRTAGVRLVTEQPAPLPAVAGDADWLRQVVAGVLENAVRHSTAGGEVRVLARAGAETIEIVVVDEGPGIPAAVLPHVFERFFRGGSATDRGLGYGIGLSLAKWIVDQHHGAVEIESPARPDGPAAGSGTDGAQSATSGEAGLGARPPGTRVTLRLPIIRPADPSVMAMGGQA
jgi:two-component system OmpR family sensor kinase